MKNQNRVLNRGLILQKIWNKPSDTTTRTIDKHVESLRKKLGDFGKKIETVIGVGYRFKLD